MSNAYVKPIFTAKLAEKITVPKTAIAIGVSSGYLYTAIRDEKISLSYELAAELIYKRDIEKKSRENAPSSMPRRTSSKPFRIWCPRSVANFTSYRKGAIK